MKKEESGKERKEVGRKERICLAAFQGESCKEKEKRE